MGKLIKYEFRKQLMSKIVVGFIIAALEIVFVLGLFLEEDSWIGVSSGFLVLTGMISLLFFSFESIITYSNDLKTKQSYMLFLTPRNMFQIVGAKILTMVIQIFLAGCVLAAIAIGDVFLVCAKYGSVQEMLENLKLFFNALTGVEIRLIEIVYVILMVLITWLVFVTMAMFAITLSTTIFANKKYKGVISVIIYFALDWIVSKIAGLVVPTGFLEGDYLVVNTEAWAYIAVYAVVLVLDFIGTSLLLEKKVSV